MQPFEVIAAPYTMYIAPLGTITVNATGGYAGAPAVNATPGSPWTTVGAAGTKSYVNTGVTISQPQTLGTFVGAGSTAIRKAWRQTEELTIALSLADMTPAQYALQINGNTVSTTTATGGVSGDQHFETYRGYLVSSYALLIKGISPFQEAYSAQYEVPAAYNAGNAAPVFSNQGPAVIAIEWHAYEFYANALGLFRAQNTP